MYLVAFHLCFIAYSFTCHLNSVSSSISCSFLLYSIKGNDGIIRVIQGIKKSVKQELLISNMTYPKSLDFAFHETACQSLLYSSSLVNFAFFLILNRLRGRPLPLRGMNASGQEKTLGYVHSHDGIVTWTLCCIFCFCCYPVYVTILCASMQCMFRTTDTVNVLKTL